MKKTLLTILSVCLLSISFSQLQVPISKGNGDTPIWPMQKAAGDSCGVYYNNYVGLAKTSTVFFEAMRTTTFEARAQLFHAAQPIEVSGFSFYAFETNPLLDSLMAICHLYDHDITNDSMGVLLAVDTVWVKHQAYSAVLPDIQVNATFDTPVTVTEDYLVAVYTEDDDSLKIIVSDFLGGDGNTEAVSYIYYSDPGAPSFHGWYNALNTYGASYDGDYLINPLVKYDLNDGFTILDDTICPELVSAGCVTYTQKANYSDAHYNSSSATPSNNLQWLWGDGFQNTNILSACHTYNNPGDYAISLNDTLYRYDFSNNVCVGQATEMIHVIDTVVADFTFITGGIIVDFTSTAGAADSLAWNFGDGNTGGDSLTIQHNYDSLGTFDVWLYAYNECGVDSVMMQVTTDDVGIDNNEFNFNLFPNPANSLISLTGLREGSTVEIINILGESILVETAVDATLELEINDLSNGTYFVRVSNDNDYLTKKLVVRK